MVTDSIYELQILQYLSLLTLVNYPIFNETSIAVGSFSEVLLII